MIVVVASEKGGTGKTTISTNLSVIRAQNASDVLLIDADPQLSASDFMRVRNEENRMPEVTYSSIMGNTIHAEIRKLTSKFDDIVIDVGGRDSSTLRSSLLVADVLVIPFLPSQYDAWGLERMDELVEAASIHNPKLKTVAFLNKVDTNPKIKLSSEAYNIASTLKSIKLKDIQIGYRVAFRVSVAEGIAVTEIKDKKDKKAIQEIKGLYEEVFRDA